MQQLRTSLRVSALILVFAVALLTGCGSSGSANGTPFTAVPPSPAPATESLVVLLTFPQEVVKVASAKPAYANTKTVVVTVLDPVTRKPVAPAVTAARPRLLFQMSVLVPGLAPGAYIVYVQCFDANGVSCGDNVSSATLGQQSGVTVSIANANELARVDVTPAVGTVSVGGTQQLTATATYTDGSQQAVTYISTWSATPSTVATVGTATGLASGLAQGQASVVATMSGVPSAPASLTVSGAAPSPSPALPPTVSALSVKGSLCDGNVTVVITGTHLTGTTAVSFGATTASTFTVNSDTQVTATAPAHAAGTVDVTVTTAGGTSATSVADQFRYAQIYVMSRTNRSVVRMDDMNGTNLTSFNGTGSVVGSFGGSNFSGPYGVALDAAGKIYVTDSDNHRIVRMDDMSGTNIIAFGSQGSAPGQFQSPAGLAFDAAGKIYIAEQQNHRIDRMDDMSGTNFISYGTQGGGSGQFFFPSGVLVDPAGKLYIADTNNNRIVRMDDMTGTNFTSYGATNNASLANCSPFQVALDPLDRVYFGHFINGNVLRMDDMIGTGLVPQTTGGPGPYGIALDGAGRIYATRFYNAGIVRMDDMNGTNRVNYTSASIDRPCSLFIY